MRLKVIGSAGALPFPRPGCFCEKCEKAREKGIPYERICSSLFIYPNILIDTPEAVYKRLNEFKIKKLDHVFYTHWHPDHLQGYRVFEIWTRRYHRGGEKKEPISVYLPKSMVKNFEERLPSFDFYEKKNYIKIIEVEDRKEIDLKGLSITPIDLKREDRVRYAYLIKEGGKKVMYAPCSVFNAKFDKYWENLDLLFLETGWHGDTEKFRERGGDPEFKDHISLEEDFKWFEKLKPDRMILTHIEGLEHQTYDFIKSKTEERPEIEPAYDGMEIEL